MVELIVLPLQCILVSILVCMISLKSGGGGGTSTRCPPASYPPVLAQSYVTPLPKYVGSMIVLVYLIVLLRELIVFRMVSLHRHSSFVHLFRAFLLLSSYAHAHVSATPSATSCIY